MRATISSALVACMLLLALAATPPGAWASGNANWGKGVELTAPANAAEDPEVYLRDLSCPAAGDCTAAGSYTAEPEPEHYLAQGELLSEAGGTWEPAVAATMPAGAASSPRPEFGALSCPSVGTCSAVGDYRDGAENEQGFLLSESAGVWGSGVEVSLPADASVHPGPSVRLGRLSCPSAGNCTAVGSYADIAGNLRGFLVGETAGTWSAVPVLPSLPANAAANPEEPMSMGGVSCTSAGNCTAVGDYTDSSGDLEGFLWTETAGVWGTGVEVTPPANAASDPLVERYGQGALSCPSAGNCTAVGDYTNSSGDTEGLLLSETSGIWGTGVEAIMPANARSEPDASIKEVQCSSAGNCTAVGNYAASNSEEYDGVFLTETAGVWGAGVERPLPANAAPQGVIEGSLSCPAAGDCSYVGNWKVNEFFSRALLVTENDGTWGPGIDGALPANVTGDPGAFLSSVSCAAPGNCTAVGSYNSYTTNFVEREGMVFTATPATAFLSTSGPLGGAFADSPISASAISATLAGGSAPSGTLTYTVFGPQPSPPSSCASGGTMVGAARAHGDGTYQPSAGFTPPSPGDYWWYAGYGGDAGDEPSASTCGAGMAETTVVPKVTPTLSASVASPIVGSSISATLTGGSAPTGTITFTVFGPQASPPASCASGGTTVGSVNVNGNGTYQPSASFTPPSPGSYWWYASYGGDAGDEPAGSACGPLMAQTLVAAAPTTGSGTEPSLGVGSSPGGGTGAKSPAPTLSRVELGSRHITAKKALALTLTLSQPVTIKVLIAQIVKGLEHGGVCKPTDRKGRRNCTTTVEKRTLTFLGSAGSNALELKLAGLGEGSYTVTILAENANGKSGPARVAFTITGK